MTQEYSFNLVDEPWLPCINVDGEIRELGLRQLFGEAHELVGLEGDSPLQTAALFRFLLVILHRVFGPTGYDAWEELWRAGKFDEKLISAYLDNWRHRFDIFHKERPFYQAADSRMKYKSTINLSHDRASGNNATLFDHHTEETGEFLIASQAARVLVTTQVYGLSMLSGIKQRFTDGICSGGIVFLIEGKSLKETLLLNAIKYPPDNDYFPISSIDDKPCWEMDNPYIPNREYPFGYLDYLTWQNRRVLFEPEFDKGKLGVRMMTMGPGLRFEPSILDSMKHYRADKKLRHVALSFNINRVLWRNSAALFTFHHELKGRSRPPATLRWLRELVEDGVLDRQKLYSCQALGMSRKDAKVFFIRADRVLLPLAYLVDEKLVEQLEDALTKAGVLASDLVQSVRLMAMHLQLPDPDNQRWDGLSSNTKGTINDWVAFTGAERHYWNRLDIPFQRLIIGLPKGVELARVKWREVLRYTAGGVFDRAVEYAGVGPRSFKAVVRGGSYLRYRIDEELPCLKKQELSESLFAEQGGA